MIRVNARDARKKLSDLLTEAEHGKTVEITRRGQVVAQLVPPPPPQQAGFPDMTEFRNSIKVKAGSPTGAELIRQVRDEQRY
jgi:prevent-host-death family protein